MAYLFLFFSIVVFIFVCVWAVLSEAAFNKVKKFLSVTFLLIVVMIVILFCIVGLSSL